MPFYAYGYGVANSSGRTEDLYTVAFATYQANVLTHHLQIFVTIRNWTSFFAITSLISLSFLWPIVALLVNYRMFTDEVLTSHIGTIIFDQFFL